MSKINSINLCIKENTAWMDDCDGMIDYFPHFTGSLKYIISKVLEYGSDKITVSVTNNNPDIPSEKRVKRICKTCGYEATNKSHMHTYANGMQQMVYTWDLIKVKEMPKPREPEYIYNPDQTFEIGDLIQNRYGDIFKVVGISNNYGKSIQFSKVMKNGKVCKRVYSNLPIGYKKVECK